ncbi:MAG TPA: lysophospholipid acyltransferase family protein [Gammaproteobacteria bacterium]|nr:lysophospholipid acyltransferase family protein [Gammaproteobacteria bacterium]
MPGRSLRLGGLVLVGLFLAGPVLMLRRFGRGGGIVHWWLRRLARVLGLRIRVRGRIPGGASLWCCNHVSWLDIVALGAVRDIVFVSKAEVGSWPLVGWLARAAGTVFLKRGAGQSQVLCETLDASLRSGQSIAIFPEGTTSDGLSVKPMYPRLFGAAIAAGTPVQPVALRFSERGALSLVAPFIGDDTFLAHLMRLLKQTEGVDVDIRLLPQVSPQGLDRRSLAHATRAIIQSGLNELFDCRFPMTNPVTAGETGHYDDGLLPSAET